LSEGPSATGPARRGAEPVGQRAGAYLEPPPTTARPGPGRPRPAQCLFSAPIAPCGGVLCFCLPSAGCGSLQPRASAGADGDWKWVYAVGGQDPRSAGLLGNRRLRAAQGQDRVCLIRGAIAVFVVVQMRLLAIKLIEVRAGHPARLFLVQRNRRASRRSSRHASGTSATAVQRHARHRSRLPPAPPGEAGKSPTKRSCGLQPVKVGSAKVLPSPGFEPGTLR
jgi:hypothetical protein